MYSSPTTNNGLLRHISVFHGTNNHLTRHISAFYSKHIRVHTTYVTFYEQLPSKAYPPAYAIIFYNTYPPSMTINFTFHSMYSLYINATFYGTNSSFTAHIRLSQQTIVSRHMFAFHEINSRLLRYKFAFHNIYLPSQQTIDFDGINLLPMTHNHLAWLMSAFHDTHLPSNCTKEINRQPPW